MSFSLSNPFFPSSDLLLTQEDMINFLKVQGMFELEVQLPAAKSKEMKQLYKIARQYARTLTRAPHNLTKLHALVERVSMMILRHPKEQLLEPERQAIAHFLRALARTPRRATGVGLRLPFL